MSPPLVLQAREKQKNLLRQRTAGQTSPQSAGPAEMPAPKVMKAEETTAPTGPLYVAQRKSIAVTLFAIQITPEETEKVIREFSSLVSQRVGSIDLQFTVLPGFATTFSFFESEEHHAQTAQLAKEFLKNDKIQNPLNIDLLETKKVTVLASCTSY